MTRLLIPWAALVSDNRRNARRGGRAHAWDYKAARDTIRAIAHGTMRYTDPLDGDVAVHLDFHPPNARRRDASNLLKCLLDGLSTVVYADDSQVKSLSYLVHAPDGTEPRVDITVQARRAA